MKSKLNAIGGFLLRQPLILFVLWALWLSLEYWGLGPFSYLFIHDNAESYIPFCLWLRQLPSRLTSTSLLPILCGVDRYSNAFSYGANLFQLLFIVLPPWLAHGLTMFVQRFLAGYFMYRFLKDVVRLPDHLSLTAGFVYPLAGLLEFGEMRLMHGLDEPGFPFLLWALCRLPLSPLPASLLMAGLLGALMSVTMGAVIGVPFLVPTSLLVALVFRQDLRGATAWLRIMLAFLVFGVACLAVNIPHYVALAMNSPLSHRTAWAHHESLLTITVTFLKDKGSLLFRWWVAALLMLPWLARPRRWERPDHGILLLLAVGFFAGTLAGSVASGLSTHIGFLRGFNFWRFDKVAPFALVCAAALGLRSLSEIRIPDGVDKGLSLSALLSLLVLGAATYSSVMVKESRWFDMRYNGKNWQALYGNLGVLELAERTAGKPPVRVATAGASHAQHPSYLLAYGLETADGYANVYPRSYHRYWSQVIEGLTNLDPEIRGFHRWGGRLYLHHGRSGEEGNFHEIPFARWYNLDLLSLANVAYFVSDSPIQDERLVPVPLPKTDQIRSEWSDLNGMQKAAARLRGRNPGKRLYIYENRQALDRFFLARRVELFEDSDSLFRALSAASLDHLKNTVSVERRCFNRSPALFTPGEPGNVRLLDYDAGESVELEATTQAPSILVFSDQYYPWWKCLVDGVPAETFPAYGAFIGVALGAGQHRVSFRYEPGYRVFGIPKGAEASVLPD